MNADAVPDGRLFVPLKTVYYRRFESSEKDVELRGQNGQFNPDTVVPGRSVELRRGYSTDDSLHGTVGDVWTDDRLRSIVTDVGVDRIAPGATVNECVKSAIDLLGGYDRYIAFAVELDGHPERDDAGTDGYTCRVAGCGFTSDSPLGAVAHATAHKNDFTRIVGRRPDDYDEVLALFNRNETPDDYTPRCTCGQLLYDGTTEHVPLQHFENCTGGDNGE